MLDGPNIAGYLAQLLASEALDPETESMEIAVGSTKDVGFEFGEEAEEEDTSEEGRGGNGEDGAVEEPLAEAEVRLAKTYGMLHPHLHF